MAIQEFERGHEYGPSDGSDGGWLCCVQRAGGRTGGAGGVPHWIGQEAPEGRRK